MKIEVAAEETKEIMSRKLWPQNKQLRGGADHFDHIEWMLVGIMEGYIQHEKAHRWLGWAQGVICCHQNVELDIFKQINKRS